jgi:sucrose-6-phosphate hydrolase SacC (GH32 family)
MSTILTRKENRVLDENNDINVLFITVCGFVQSCPEQQNNNKNIFVDKSSVCCFEFRNVANISCDNSLLIFATLAGARVIRLPSSILWRGVGYTEHACPFTF